MYEYIVQRAVLNININVRAQVNWHLEVMNELLDNGADVNYLTDEGVSALSATLIQYYGRVEERKRELEAKARERERLAKERELERLRELALIHLKEPGSAGSTGAAGTEVAGQDAAGSFGSVAGTSGSGDQTRAPPSGTAHHLFFIYSYNHT